MQVDLSKYFHTNSKLAYIKLKTISTPLSVPMVYLNNSFATTYLKIHLGLLKIQKIDRKYLQSSEDNLNLELCGSRKRLPNYYYYTSMLYEQFKTFMTHCSLTGIEACQFNQCDLFFEDS